MPDTTDGRFLRPMDIVKRRGFPRTRLYADIASGALPTLRLGRSVLIEEAEFDRYIARIKAGEFAAQRGSVLDIRAKLGRL